MEEFRVKPNKEIILTILQFKEWLEHRGFKNHLRPKTNLEAMDLRMMMNLKKELGREKSGHVKNQGLDNINLLQ